VACRRDDFDFVRGVVLRQSGAQCVKPGNRFVDELCVPGAPVLAGKIIGWLTAPCGLKAVLKVDGLGCGHHGLPSLARYKIDKGFEGVACRQYGAVRGLRFCFEVVKAWLPKQIANERAYALRWLYEVFRFDDVAHDVPLNLSQP